ncbi:L-arabinose transport system permease protein AraQ [compost metagenome]
MRVQEPRAFKAGEAADIGDGETLLVNADGSYEYSKASSFEGSRGKRVYISVGTPPVFTLDNYRTVLTSEGIGQSFVNSLTVAVPATVIPILIAAFAAYGLSWMSFSGRNFLIAMVVGLIVVPLQMSLIPLLKLYNEIGNIFGVPSKTYAGIWLAHTAFGLPLAIYLLRNYISGLPKEIIESARVDGASDFEIFVKIILPLSFPALASFAIFQFLWTWNDLLVAMVFLGTGDNELVLTGRLVNLLGSRGGKWEILTASAFITIIVPLLVFFTLQRYLVRGLLAGSVKGG